MSDLFGISVSALQAFQTAIAVTGQNIANANTAGYAVETVDLTSAAPQGAGGTWVGAGVDVSSITRSVDQLKNNQLNTSQSALGQLNSQQTYTTQVDNIVGTTAGGLTTALQNYYGAWSTVANNPSSTSAREALLGQTQSVADSFQSTASQLQGLDTSINAGITSDVTQINSLAASISTLNSQIVIGTANGGNEAPNELLDQRDAALSSLSKLVGVTTSTDSDGALNVFVGNGQPLVLQGSTTQLATSANKFNSSQLEVTTTTNSGNAISAQITSGDLGGLLAARAQVVNPAINQLGQLATALSTSANAQQNVGLDLNGNIGANLFSVSTPQAVASSANTGTAAATVSISNVGALTADNYTLSYKGGNYSLADATTGSAVALTVTGNGTTANPTTLTAATGGLSIVMSGAPASGDQFLVEPTAQAAGSFGVALTNTSQIAAANALQTSAASSNTGSATIGNASVVLPLQSASTLLTTASINFSSSSQYKINNTGITYTLPASGLISQNGWQVTISGLPSANDVFTVQSNAGASGDNRNALASASLETSGVLSNKTISVSAATGAFVTAIGSQAQEVNTAQTAQAAVNSQALASVQSVSGVNLDEEAAKLLQWQQAYQAAAQALQIGNATFATLLSAIKG